MALRSLSAGLAAELVWVRPNIWRRRSELRTDGETVATLVGQTKLRSRAVATTADGEGILARTGFWPTRISVWRPGAKAELARFDAGRRGGGSLRVAGGATLWWVPGNVWRTRWGWDDAAGRRLIGFRRRRSGLRVECVVEVDADPPASLDLLVCLGWYLFVLTGNPGGGVSAGEAAG